MLLRDVSLLCSCAGTNVAGDLHCVSLLRHRISPVRHELNKSICQDSKQQRARSNKQPSRYTHMHTHTHHRHTYPMFFMTCNARGLVGSGRSRSGAARHRSAAPTSQEHHRSSAGITGSRKVLTGCHRVQVSKFEFSRFFNFSRAVRWLPVKERLIPVRNKHHHGVPRH